MELENETHEELLDDEQSEPTEVEDNSESEEAEDTASNLGGSGEPEPEGEPQVAQKSRAQERIERQQAELKAAREAAEQAQRQAQDLERRMAELQASQERARQQEQMQYMSPEERAVFEQQARMTEMQQQIQRVQFEMQDSVDKASFMAQTASNPIYAKYKDQVESELAKMRSKGQTAPRESVLAFIVGQEVVKKGPSAISRQRSAGAQRVANAQKQSTTGRSSVSRAELGSGDSIEDLEARLRGVPL